MLPFTSSDIPLDDPEIHARVSNSQDIGFLVVGFPENSNHLKDNWDGKSITVKMLPVWPIEGSMPRLRYEPRWTEEEHQGTIRGMSGGPVVMIIDGQVIWTGVQSASYGIEDKRPQSILIGDSASFFQYMLELQSVANLAASSSH